VGRKLVGLGSGASLEDEGAEEAIPSVKPRSPEPGFPPVFLCGVGSTEFAGRKEGRQAGRAVSAVWSPGAAHRSPVGRPAAGAGRGRQNASTGSVPSPGAEPRPPAPERRVQQSVRSIAIMSAAAEQGNRVARA